MLAPVKAGTRLQARTLADHLAARLARVPLMRQTFVQDALRLGSVHRVEDPAFDVSRHVAARRLPAPGGYTELTRSVAGLLEEPLGLAERWRWTVLDGLAGGRAAVVLRIHHALADGVGASTALASIYDPHPVPAEKPRRHDRAPPLPGAGKLLTRAFGESAQRWLREVPRFAGTHGAELFGALAGRFAGGEPEADAPPGAIRWGGVQPCALNTRESSLQRRISYRSLPRARLKSLATRLGCTVNDLGLLLFSMALERHLESVGQAADFDLYCAMPLDERTAQRGAGGNRVSLGTINLHNTVADPLARLQAIHADAARIKAASRDAPPGIELQEVADLVPPLALETLCRVARRLDLMGRIGERIALLNAIFSNVPGSPVPVYIANARIEDSIPLIPLMNGVAVSGGLSSSAETITLGFNCDAAVVEDAEPMAETVTLGLQRLEAAARTRAARARRGRATKRG
jgi:WS/DGAT/MGAT family acyltransferase